MKRTLLPFILALCVFAQKPEKPLKNGLYAIFKTEFGDMRALLFEKDTPNTVALFVGLAQGTQSFRDPKGAIVKARYYDDTTFFRIMPGEMVQGGGRDGTTTYNCGLTIKDETLPGITFRNGSLAMANGGPDTGGCEFFFTTGTQVSWNNKYSIFGQVVEGLDVLQKLSRVPVHDEKPENPPKLISVVLNRVGPMPEPKKKK